MTPGSRPQPQPPGGAPPPPEGQPPAQAAPRRPPGPRPPRQQIKPRRHRNGKASRARGGLLIVFALLRLVDAFFLIALPNGPTSQALVATFLVGMWTTALLIAIWRRQQWARILTIALFILCTVAAMVLIPSSSQNAPMLTAYLVAGLVALGTSVWLIYSRDVRRLTSRDRE